MTAIFQLRTTTLSSRTKLRLKYSRRFNFERKTGGFALRIIEGLRDARNRFICLRLICPDSYRGKQWNNGSIVFFFHATFDGRPKGEGIPYKKLEVQKTFQLQLVVARAFCVARHRCSKWHVLFPFRDRYPHIFNAYSLKTDGIYYVYSI